MIRFRYILLFLPLLIGLWGCQSINQPTPIPVTFPPTPTQTPTPLPALPTATVTPPGCLTQPGRVEQGVVNETDPPQEFLIYLPPCYDENANSRYPVLYLLHGQTYTADQWVRLGAVEMADRLILGGEAIPFIIVFPDDRFWNLQAGPGFGKRMVDSLVPYVDKNFRTVAVREQRAIGGMSRGAGWALRLGLTRWDLFGSIGLHSMAIFNDDASSLGRWLLAIPPEAWPRFYMDIGDNDQELDASREFEALLSDLSVPHEWHLYAGAHEEGYWRAHVEEYIRWYARGWKSEATGQ